jgi:hypothetical protein
MFHHFSDCLRYKASLHEFSTHKKPTPLNLGRITFLINFRLLVAIEGKDYGQFYFIINMTQKKRQIFQ